MKTRIVTIICIAIASFALPAQAKKKSQPAPAATPEPAATGPGEKLSRFLKANLESIIAPLDGKGFKQPEQIVELSESLADDMSKAPPAAKPVYQAAIAVCNALSQAAAERQKMVAGLSASTAVKGDSSLGARRKDNAGVLETVREQDENKQRQKQAKQTDSFFTASQKQQWTTRSGLLRQNIEQLYARERELERENNAAVAAKAAAAATPVAPPAPAPAPEAPAKP